MKHKRSSTNYLNTYSELGGYKVFNFISERYGGRTRSYRFISKYKLYDI